MASNLANVYANLLRLYGENYTLTYSAPPTYLDKIVGCEESTGKIVLFYIEDRNKAKFAKFISPSKLNIKKTTQIDLDLTGSPLKDNCIVDAIGDLSIDLRIEDEHAWKIEEEYHKGISIDKARAIICNEDFQLNAERDQCGSVWFLCNGDDSEKTLMLQYEFRPDYFSRGILCFSGVIPVYFVTTQMLLKKHNAVLSPGGTRIETYIENTYQIQNHIEIRCAWSTVASLPSLVDLTSCEVVLRQSFRLSDCGASTQDFMNQLLLLDYIRADILEFRRAEKAGIQKEPLYRCGRGIDMEELRDSINKVMTEISGFTEIGIEGRAESDIEDVIQRAQMRNLIDLTDKLWDILKCCSSYKDLKMAFNILFQCAARCNIVNTPTNKNRLAEIITELANRRLAIPCLTGVEPLELLLEIGLEKLYKDYEFIFIESKICSANLLKLNNTVDANKGLDQALPQVRKSLHNAVGIESTNKRKTLLHNNVSKDANKFQNDDIIGFKNSNFDEHETAMKIAKLVQIHCTLEHLLMIHIHLNLSNVYSDVCAQLLNKPARIFDSIDETWSDVMEISLAAHYVRDHLKGKDPHTRRIIMKSKNKFRLVKSIFYYSMENICPPNIGECFQCEDKELVKENIYYAWMYRKIQTLKN